MRAGGKKKKTESAAKKQVGKFDHFWNEDGRKAEVFFFFDVSR